MKVVVNSQALAIELRIVNKVAAVKPTIPILSHVLVTASMEGLTLEATDLEVGLSTRCQAIVSEPGIVALPAKRLLDLLEQFPEGDVEVAFDGKRVTVKSGSFKSRLQAMNAADFPKLPEVEGIVARLQFGPLLARTRYAIADKGSKFVLNGALLSLGKAAAMVTTDSKRLSIATAAYAGEAMEAIVPSQAMDVLASFEGAVDFSQNDRNLFFASGDRVLTSRKIDGKFPQYDRIIPRNNDKTISVDRHMLMAAVKRVGIVSEANYACYFHATPGLVTITSSSAEVGDANEEVAASYDGPPLKACVNWRYVLDFLEAASGQRVEVKLKDEQTPMLLLDGDSFVNVVMLMRV